MNEVIEQTYLADILHIISQGLLAPTMAIIILLIAVSLFFIGQIIVEFFSERRSFKQNIPAIINEINDASYDDVTDAIEQSKLLKFQKAALIIGSRNMGLPEESLFALAQVQCATMARRYQRRVAWTDTIAKIGPMLGLMGTLIPLGPGIVALGQNDLSTLSSSLLVAFDATVCGLVCAIVALIISKIRSGWYQEYTNTLEAVMSCVIEKAAEAREAGIKLPTNYSGDPIAELKAMKHGLKTPPVNAGSQAAANASAASGTSDEPASSDVTASVDAATAASSAIAASAPARTKEGR